MTTRTGRVIRATANHQFRMLDGWRALEELRPGDRIAIPRVYPEPVQPAVWSDDRVTLLAHMLGDGCFAPRQPLHYTSASEENLRVVADAARSAFGVEGRYVAQRTWCHLYPSSGGNRWHPNPITAWLRDLGLDGLRSYQKFVPPPIFRLPSVGVGLFLRHLWATDGCVHLREGRHGPIGTIYYGTTSPLLAAQVQYLLARLGIVSRIVSTRKGEYQPSHNVQIMGATDQLRFADAVGGIGDRAERLANLVARVSLIKANTNADTVPVEIWPMVKETMRHQGITQRRMARMRGTAYGGTSHFRFAPSRAVLANYGELLDMPALVELAGSDVYWDVIDSIEPDGEADVYDMTVPDTHNFIANGIVAHNSIEQDADIVMFIYREDYYTQRDEWENNNPDRPTKSFPAGIAQIIVAKHRNGPTGNVDVRFVQKTAKYEDLMARDDEPV
jgi:replicative DNA helicase